MTSRLSVPLILMLVLTSASLAFFIYYGQWFPPRMAVHFDSDGVPNGWMDRVVFIVIGASECFIIPPFIVACVGVMPRVLPVRMLNIPNRDFWLAPERQKATLDRLMYFGLWLGCIVQAFLFALNVIIARANPAAGPPHAPDGAALTTAVFIGALLTWGFGLIRTFRRPQ